MQHGCYITPGQEIFEHIEVFYKCSLLNSAIRYETPENYENQRKNA
jgi:hypothetical protein